LGELGPAVITSNDNNHSKIHVEIVQTAYLEEIKKKRKGKKEFS
jgi:hypothetical protein